MYLNVTYFHSAFVATSGGADNGCPRVVKRIAVTNDFGKSLFNPWLRDEKSLFRDLEVKLFAIGCGEQQRTSLSLRTIFKIFCCCFIVVLLGWMYITTLSVFDYVFLTELFLCRVSEIPRYLHQSLYRRQELQ